MWDLRVCRLRIYDYDKYSEYIYIYKLYCNYCNNTYK